MPCCTVPCPQVVHAEANALLNKNQAIVTGAVSVWGGRRRHAYITWSSGCAFKAKELLYNKKAHLHGLLCGCGLTRGLAWCGSLACTAMLCPQAATLLTVSLFLCCALPVATAHLRDPVPMQRVRQAAHTGWHHRGHLCRGGCVDGVIIWYSVAKMAIQACRGQGTCRLCGLWHQGASLADQRASVHWFAGQAGANRPEASHYGTCSCS